MLPKNQTLNHLFHYKTFFLLLGMLSLLLLSWQSVDNRSTPATNNHKDDKRIWQSNKNKPLQDAEFYNDSIIPLVLIPHAPVFPGCERYEDDNKELKNCLNRKIAMFVKENFNRKVINDLKIKSGKGVRVYVQFIVDENGKVKDVKVRSMYKTLEKEAIRVFQKLPKMKPGLTGDGKPVSVVIHVTIQFNESSGFTPQIPISRKAQTDLYEE